MEIFTFPHELTMDSSIQFINHIFDNTGHDEYMFDFNNLSWIEPFSLLYVSKHIKEFLDLNKKSNIQFNIPNNKIHSRDCLSYADHMAFFRSCGFGFGTKVVKKKGNNNYIPITSMPIKKLDKKANNRYTKIHNIIEEEAQRLSQVLTHTNNGPVFDVISYSFREIIRNVYEHSNSESYEYCGQYWPTKQKAELCLIDNGIGLKASLLNNPYLEIENDRDAVLMSYLPGISGKMYKGVKKVKHDVWQNSGYGLYMLNRICRNGNGSFFLASYSSGIMVERNDKIDFTTKVKGTCIRLVLDISSINNLRDILTKFSKEGNAISSKYKGTSKIKASTASRMVSEDFML
ncbi:MAG: hypothetical protein AB7W47_09085 [Calditrichaceae bacterium]